CFWGGNKGGKFFLYFPPKKLRASYGPVRPIVHFWVCDYQETKHSGTNLNCRTDYIAVYDGGLGSSRQLGRICLATRHVFISTSNAMTVVLYRNSFNAGPSFTAYYYITPQGKM
uniref:CUB domain-containing protein n=1 Tax=Podarcis muralis TaxID=64176 RepID=A0A670ICJ7_PODMU